MFHAALSARAKQRRAEQPDASELEALEAAPKHMFPLLHGVFGGQLRYACSGAAALSRDVAEFMETLGIEVYEGYSMSQGVVTGYHKQPDAS